MPAADLADSTRTLAKQVEETYLGLKKVSGEEAAQQDELFETLDEVQRMLGALPHKLVSQAKRASSLSLSLGLLAPCVSILTESGVLARSDRRSPVGSTAAAADGARARPARDGKVQAGASKGACCVGLPVL